jgi:hypothetical protein
MGQTFGAEWGKHKRSVAAGEKGGAILIAGAPHFRPPWAMGAKYLPTIKDLKASERFKQKQSPLHKFKKSPGAQPAKKGKTK